MNVSLRKKGAVIFTHFFSKKIPERSEYLNRGSHMCNIEENNGNTYHIYFSALLGIPPLPGYKIPRPAEICRSPVHTSAQDFNVRIQNPRDPYILCIAQSPGKSPPCDPAPTPSPVPTHLSRSPQTQTILPHHHISTPDNTTSPTPPHQYCPPPSTKRPHQHSTDYRQPDRTAIDGFPPT